jgi:hypothetical protein
MWGDVKRVHFECVIKLIIQVEVKGELEKPYDPNEPNFTKQILHKMAVSRFQFRQPPTDNFLEQQRYGTINHFANNSQKRS